MKTRSPHTTRQPGVTLGQKRGAGQELGPSEHGGGSARSDVRPSLCDDAPAQQDTGHRRTGVGAWGPSVLSFNVSVSLRLSFDMTFC